MQNVIVDFVIRQADEQSAPVEVLRQPCDCGANQFVLVSEMKAESIKGMPASRMYECMACGEYQLG